MQSGCHGGVALALSVETSHPPRDAGISSAPATSAPADNTVFIYLFRDCPQCSSQIGFTFLVLAYPGSPGKGPLNVSV